MGKISKSGKIAHMKMKQPKMNSNANMKSVSITVKEDHGCKKKRENARTNGSKIWKERLGGFKDQSGIGGKSQTAIERGQHGQPHQRDRWHAICSKKYAGLGRRPWRQNKVELKTKIKKFDSKKVNEASLSQKQQQIVEAGIIEKKHEHELYLLMGALGAISWRRGLEIGIGPFF